MDETAVAVAGLRRRFGKVEAVRDLTLKAPYGELHALVGANGAGKTTALRLLCGLLPSEGGEGSVLGLDLRAAPRRVAARVGYMSQRLALHADLTVRETLAFRAEVYGLPDPKARLAELMERFDLAPRRDVRAGTLSGGWARRLQLAAVLVHAPRLLLLDEPAVGLDYDAQQALWREIAALAQDGAAVIVNTHDPLEAERCARLTVMTDGRTTVSGTPAELIARAGLDPAAPGARLDRAWPALVSRQGAAA